MRLMKMMRLLFYDVKRIEPFWLWWCWGVVSLLVDTVALYYAYPGDMSNFNSPVALHIFKWALVVEIAPLLMVAFSRITPYFSLKWEQTKASESDKDTLLRGSRERA